MLQVTKTVFVLLSLVITVVAIGQDSVGSEAPAYQEYKGSADLPNGIAFHMTLLLLDHINTKFGPTDSASLVEEELGLSNVESHVFVSQALTALYLMQTEAKEQVTRLACRFTGPHVKKEDKYAALQQMSVVRTAVYDNYYDQTKANLGADTGERLQRWMDDAKSSTISSETDFERADQQSGRDSTVTLAEMCERGNL